MIKEARRRAVMSSTPVLLLAVAVTILLGLQTGRAQEVGRSQALELVANHLAPLAMHEGGMSFRSYQKLRNSAPNEKVKRCAIRLFGSTKAAEPWTRRVCHHQALLQIYQDFCLEDFSDCQNCPFPEQLMQWK
jgi:hypothetical protein